MGVFDFESLRSHVGHKIVCVEYGNEESGVVNVAVECKDCDEVLFDYDKPEDADYVNFTKEESDNKTYILRKVSISRTISDLFKGDLLFIKQKLKDVIDADRYGFDNVEELYKQREADSDFSIKKEKEIDPSLCKKNFTDFNGHTIESCINCGMYLPEHKFVSYLIISEEEIESNLNNFIYEVNLYQMGKLNDWPDAYDHDVTYDEVYAKYPDFDDIISRGGCIE